jgi:outer membrane protein
MKKLTLIINIVFALAIIGLYILFFSQKKSSVNNNTGNFTSTALKSNLRIAYINMDTLLMNYLMYRDLNNDLNAKRNIVEADLQKKSVDFQKQASDYQEKVSKGLITHYKAQEMEAELAKVQDNLLKYRDDQEAKLMEEARVMNNQVYYEISEFLKEYNKDKNLTFIINNTAGNPLIYVNDTLNITREVVEGLNARYEKTKKSGQKKK